MTIPGFIDTQRAAGLIPEGVRNTSLTAYAGGLRSRGFDAADILQALREENRERCAPPLPDWEIRNISKSAAKWKPFGTQRGGEWRAANILSGCFDPRPAVCGFDAAAIVEADSTLRLKRRHKLLFGLLQDLYGPFGCHPAQATLAAALLTTRQQIARNVERLVRVGLIQVEPGAFKRAGAKYPCTSYHFLKHPLYRAHFGASIPSVFSDMAENMQQFPQATNARCLENEQDGRKHATRSTQVTYISAPALPKRTRAEILPFDFETAGAFKACVGPDKGRMIPYASILQYSECVSGCGGCRIVYSDGTVKRYECVCENAGAAAHSPLHLAALFCSACCPCCNEQATGASAA
jgi:hypothetical protein